MQARFHQTPPPAVLREESRSWIDRAEPDDALRRIPLAADGEIALLHLDDHPMNVLVDRGKISAVLDWTNVRAGDSRADLAVAGQVHGMAPFYAWAAAFMVRDLAPRVGRPDLPWLTEDLLAHVRAWGDEWLAWSM